ncbi:aldo/keto reductase [Tolypothrix sp. FACHB-123]|nr:aldo/keto reductase [Tolypothrix sp. FACHB-123]
MERSLQRFNTNFLDLWQLHRVYLRKHIQLFS